MESGAYSRASAQPEASNCTSLSHIDLISSCLALSAQGYGMPSNKNASTPLSWNLVPTKGKYPACRHSTGSLQVPSCLHVHKHTRNLCFNE